jgi:putative transposase
MLRRDPLVTGETYHVYNRGAHKQAIFTNEQDYFRFSLLLHLANSKTPFELRTIFKKYGGRSSADIFTGEKIENRLVDILAYCLMPNHFHLVVRQKEEGGVAQFMKKLSTGYSMYFNTKYKHSGVLFQGRFKSRHISNEKYFRYIFSYVHLNPFDLFEPGWKERGFANRKAARDFLSAYPYSSFRDYSISNRSEGAILSSETAADFLKTQNDLDGLLSWQDTEDRPPYLGEIDSVAHPR